MVMVCTGKGDLADGLVEEEGGAKAVGVQGQPVVNLQQYITTYCSI